uniref:Uncharacterized protein n=1 Tax=Tetraselmis sp. GSL018 TaxID=582737 RepID=A0A061QU14_9CHLO
MTSERGKEDPGAPSRTTITQACACCHCAVSLVIPYSTCFNQSKV